MDNYYKERSILIRNRKIKYYDIGTGKPILIIHGWLSCKDLYIPVIDELSKMYRVIAVDLPGFGESDPIIENDYLIETVAILNVFIKQLRLSKVNIIGNSFGGVMAILLSKKHPDRIRRLILRSVPIVYLQLPRLVTNSIVYRLFKHTSKIGLVRNIQFKICGYFFHKVHHQRSHIEANSKRKKLIDIATSNCEKSLKSLSVENARTVALYLLRVDVRKQFSEISKNCTVLVSSRDKLVRQNAEIYHNSKCEIVKHSEHHTLLDYNQEFIDLVCKTFKRKY